MTPNVNAKIVDGIMHIEIDLSQEFGPSGSGKSTIIASSQGAAQIGDVVMNLNVYRKAVK